MKNIPALVIVYICLDICKYVGAYFTATCRYVGYVCIFIFPVEVCVILRLHCYKDFCCGYLFYVSPLPFVR